MCNLHLRCIRVNDCKQLVRIAFGSEWPRDDALKDAKWHRDEHRDAPNDERHGDTHSVPHSRHSERMNDHQVPIDVGAQNE